MSYLFHRSIRSASAGDSRVSDRTRRLFAFYDDSIVVTIEGQRIAPDSAMSRVGNHGRTAGQDELAVGGGVDELFAGSAAACILDGDMVLGDDLAQLRGCVDGCLTGASGIENHVHGVGKYGDLRAFGDDTPGEVRA